MATGEGVLQLREVQRAGARRMTAAEFARGQGCGRARAWATRAWADVFPASNRRHPEFAVGVREFQRLAPGIAAWG